MGWKEAGQGEMTGILFWTPALSSSMSKPVSQSPQHLSVPVSVSVLDNPDSLPFLVYNFPWWIPTGREGDGPPH